MLRKYGVAHYSKDGMALNLFEGPSRSDLTNILADCGIPEEHPLGKRLLAEASKYVGERFAALTEAMDTEDPIGPDPAEPVDEDDVYPDG